jgi:hypothetical protein
VDPRFPYQRYDTLRVGTPYPLTLLAAYPDELLPEAVLHKVFADSRLGGEWFSPTPLLLDLIETVARCHSLADPRLRGRP